MLLFLFAFISGLVTIAAPCIWPLLPIVLSASSTGGHRKPFGVTLGILLSFGFFTLTISYIEKILPINFDLLRLFAVIVIAFFGLVLLIPQLSAIVEGYVSKLSSKTGTGKPKSGFIGGLITGLSLGIVWSPCAGPILATIATVAATTKVSGDAILVTFFYLLGVGIPLLIFSLLGRKILTGTKRLSPYTSKIQRVFGVIMILTAVLIYFNLDKTISADLLNYFPSYSNALNNFESSGLIKNDLSNLRGNTNSTLNLPNQTSSDQASLLNTNQPEVELTGITNWLNSPPLTLSQLKGKVVLIDFWTYTCINCIRTLPHIESWYQQFKDKGFVVIGVHTPEFEFEHNTANVAAAIKQYGITYPVAQDNNYATWNAYNNQYWPAEYLIDAKGVIRRVNFGEGDYENMQQAIVELLKEAGQNVSGVKTTMPDETPVEQTSPETYVGSARMQYEYPDGVVGQGDQTFKLYDDLPVNSFSFGGEWQVDSESSTTVSSSEIEYNFTGNEVYLVMNPAATGASTVKVLLDGKTISAAQAGTDVVNGVITLDNDRLYNLVNLHGKAGQHKLILQFQNPGIQAFAFTFG